MKKKAFFALLLLLIVGFVYCQTIAPSLTWANQGTDGGDLITAAAIRGIAHPSGYPLYLIIARGFQLIPLSDLAFKTNLMSAFFGVLTVLLAYGLLVRILPGDKAPIAAFFAALIFGVSPLFWSQAIITEVYTLHLFLVVSLSYVFLFFPDRKGLQGFLLGLAVGNHLTAFVFLPAFYALTFSEKTERKSHERSKGLLIQTGFFLLGASVYFLLPIRALQHPALNWEDPVSWQNFWHLISGRIYRSAYFGIDIASLFTKVQLGASLLLAQYQIWGLVLGFTGLVFLFRKTPFYALTLWLSITSWGIFLLYQAPSASLYLLPFFFAFSCWLGMAFGKLLSFSWKETLSSYLLFLFLIGSLVWQTDQNWQLVDASQDTRADDFVAQIMVNAPADAIIVAKGDAAVFSLWYGHYALGQRPDLVVLAEDLLGYGWYQETIRRHYPLLDLPPYFPWASAVLASNPQRPYCQVAYDLSGKLSCFSVGE